MIKITLKNRKKPDKLTLNKNEIFHLKAVYYILLEEIVDFNTGKKHGIANIYNSYTHIKYKFNYQGFFRVDERSIERLKNNVKIVCENQN